MRVGVVVRMPARAQIAGGARLIGTADRRRPRRFVQRVRVLVDLAVHCAHRVGERVESFDRLGLGRLDHHRFVDDEREIDGRRVEAVIDDPFRDVHRSSSARFLLARGQHELVHRL